MPLNFDVGSLAGSLVGGAMSLFGNAQYNRQQAALTRETNAQNLKMFQDAQAFNRQERLESQDFNRSMAEMQMRYNSPAAQAQRLSAAGLNPANVMGGDAGNLQSAPSSSPSSSPGIPAMQTPSQVPLLSSGDISNVMNSVSNMLNVREDVKGKQISNEFARNREIANLDKMIAEKQKLLSDKDLSYAQRMKIQSECDEIESRRELLAVQIRRENKAAEYDDQLFSGLVQQYKDNHNSSVLTQESQRLANEIQSKFGMKMKEREYINLCLASKHIIAELGLLFSQKNLNEKQALNIIADTTSKYLGNIGQFKDLKVRDKLNQLLLKSAHWNVRQQQQDFSNPFKYVGGLFSGISSAALKLIK